MSKKRKGKCNLLEALDLISESTVAGNYPDTGGIAGGDDTPTSNILLAPRYKEISYFNRLTSFNRNWTHDDSDWKWDVFANAKGQESLDSYSNTLQSMKSLFPKKTWELAWGRMKKVSDKSTIATFKQSGKEDRDVKNQLGKEKDPHAEVDVKKNQEVTGSTIKNEERKKNNLINRINRVII